ncbi:MAG: tetratricopeptide repeat protein [Cyclobacteriaceae bacterium]|nr:tetratricopeptide repeat protein [Cyclobacteriaceae bacterium]
MKKTLFTLLALVPAMALAQVKPSIPKAEKALREGKIDEAKTIIDATTSNQEFMVDKKGQPTKNAAKAWFLRGLVYAAMDTTKNTPFKTLDPNPFAQSKEAFEKSAALDSKTESFFNGPTGFPMSNTDAKLMIGNSYFNQAIVAYNDEGNPKKALEMAEKTMFFMPTDTTLYFYTGAFALEANEPDKSIKYLEQYVTNGGKQPQAYASIANVYIENKKDNVNALRVIKEGQAKYPAYRDLRLLELNIYLNEKRYDVAKAMVEKEVAADPSNRDNYFLYGQLNRELGNTEEAKKAFKKALEIDPKFFEAASDLANLYWLDAKKYKDEMGKLGNSKEDLQKKFALDPPYTEALRKAIPYIEACEKMSPDDVNTLYMLLNAYSDLDEKPKIDRVKKRLKTLGEDID